MTTSPSTTSAAGEPRVGIAPPGYRLPDAAHLGRVVLQVADLQRSVAYYEQVVGLRRGERRGRLVEDQHTRPAGHSAGDLDELPQRDREPVHRFVGPAGTELGMRVVQVDVVVVEDEIGSGARIMSEMIRSSR